MIIVAPNLPDEYHMKYVAKKMKKLGVPRIRAIWSKTYNMWFAAEGSHRIAVAHKAGIIPIIIDITGEDAIVQKNEENTKMTARELEDWLISDPTAPRYVFDENS